MAAAAVAREKNGTPRRTVSHKFRAQDFVRRRNNETLTDHYTLGKLLGDGQFGEVFLGTVTKSNGGKGDTRAIKRIQKELLSEEDHEEVFNEFMLLKQMDHPNICKMYEFFEDPDDFWFVQEFCSGGELLDELERVDTFSEAAAGLIMKQVLGSIHYCHSQKHICHRDLKLENILFDKPQKAAADAVYQPIIVKVIDFGLATIFSQDQVLSEPVGSMHYVAPEVLECEYNFKCDIWSCGVIAFVLLSGYAPFEAANDRDMRELIMMGDFDFDDPLWENVSKEAKDFVSFLLTYEPEKRPDAFQALQHPWIQNISKAHAQQLKATKSGTDAAVKFLSNCRSFEAASKLKQATCAFMTSQLVLSSEEEEQSSTSEELSISTGTMIGEIFRAMDLDADGQLTKEELRMGFQDFLGDSVSAPPSVEEMDDVFQRMDLSSTGFIEYSEFVVACMGLHDQEQPQNQQLLKQAFERLLDKDGSGVISHGKLRKEMAPFYGADAEEAVIQKIIDQVDIDIDGQISWGDFQAMMSKTASFVAPKIATPEVAPQKSSGVSRKPSKSEISTGLSNPAISEEDVTSDDDSDSDSSSSSSSSGEESSSDEESSSSDDESSTDEEAEEEMPEQPVVKKQPKIIRKQPSLKKQAKVIRKQPSLKKQAKIIRKQQRIVILAPQRPPSPARKVRASIHGPKARLISAMFEKNLDKNRSMGMDAFSYIRKKPKVGQKRIFPRTRRINFEANYQIKFGAKEIMEGRNAEIDEFKTTNAGRASERRASLVSMLQQEKLDGKREGRLQELESLKNQTSGAQVRRSSLENSYQDCSTRKLELRKREQRCEELEKIKKVIRDDNAAKKQLFESWNEANLRTSAAEKHTSRLGALKGLKDFHETYAKPEPLNINSQTIANRLAAIPTSSNKGRKSRSWTRRLSGKAHTRESIKENAKDKDNSNVERPRLDRTTSHSVIQGSVQHIEERLVGMQPKAKTKKSARLIEPLRRLNSFDSDHEQDERDERLNDMAPVSILSALPVPELLSISEDSSDVSPVRKRQSCFESPTQKDKRLYELQGEQNSFVNSPQAEAISSPESVVKREAQFEELGQVKLQSCRGAKNAREQFEKNIQGNQQKPTSWGAMLRSKSVEVSTGKYSLKAKAAPECDRKRNSIALANDDKRRYSLSAPRASMSTIKDQEETDDTKEELDNTMLRSKSVEVTGKYNLKSQADSEKKRNSIAAVNDNKRQYSMSTLKVETKRRGSMSTIDSTSVPGTETAKRRGSMSTVESMSVPNTETAKRRGSMSNVDSKNIEKTNQKAIPNGKKSDTISVVELGGQGETDKTELLRKERSDSSSSLHEKSEMDAILQGSCNSIEAGSAGEAADARSPEARSPKPSVMQMSAPELPVASPSPGKPVRSPKPSAMQMSAPELPVASPSPGKPVRSPKPSVMQRSAPELPVASPSPSKPVLPRTPKRRSIRTPRNVPRFGSPNQPRSKSRGRYSVMPRTTGFGVSGVHKPLPLSRRASASATMTNPDEMTEEQRAFLNMARNRATRKAGE